MSSRPPGIPTTLAFLVLSDPGEVDPTLLSACTGCADLHAWRALPRDLLGPSPQGAAGPGTGYDLVLEAVGSAAADRLAVALAAATGLDRARSLAFVGTGYEIVGGEGDVALFCPLVRLGHLTAAGFQRYWLDVHADFGRRNPVNGYRQIHPRGSATQPAGLPDAPFDGVAQALFADLPAMQARLASPDIAGDAYEDERRFIDHARSAFLPFVRIAP
ncbi:EthD domain-containing protein [Rhizorhabdus phycosphaerae]|uniref:EthD domain-containing protein n=1 Tax=Rhizorhabdus phycosphaerae TaxID=2711156 RepID=UPI0013EA736F|nr:EthD domain-containing protein [Rhizorhabdus phycosphaerae]